MLQTGTIEIPLSKTKLTLLTLGAAVFVAFGFWFVIAPPVIKHPLYGNPAVILAAGILSIVFFGLCGVIGVKKLFDKTPGLTINNQGISDNSSGISAGLIAWKDIIEIRKQNLMSQNFLILVVRNPEEYLNRQTNILKRKPMELNLKSYGSPIAVSANSLKINFDELAALLERKFDEQKHLA